MQVSDRVNNIIDDKKDPDKKAKTEKTPPDTVQPQQTEVKPPPADEIVIQRETTINIKEEFKVSGNFKTGPVPSMPVLKLVIESEEDPFKISETLLAIDGILNLEATEQLESKKAEFNKSLEGMNTTQFLQVSQQLGSLLQKTDANDDLLGDLQQLVFSKMKEQLDQRVILQPAQRLPVPETN